MELDLNWKIFMVLFSAQFGFPFLASTIKRRFRELGYEMKSEPFWSLFNISNFWNEARETNRTYKDAKISQLLYVRTGWWVLVAICFIGLAV